MMLKTEQGVFSARFFSRQGPEVLLVHGTGHNRAVWEPLAALLKGDFRVAAFDMRGHGQTPLDSADPEQYWRDIACVSRALGFRKPLLVGHSTGGYAVVAHAAAGGACSGLVVLDGFVLDGRKTPAEAEAWYLPREQLTALFRYGWAATRTERDAYVAEVWRQVPGDWLNDGLDPSLVAAFTRRSFLKRGNRYLRRPTFEELAIVGNPDPSAAFYPSIDLYDKVEVPAAFVWAARGLYAARREDVRGVVSKKRNRLFREADCGHNVQMQRPGLVAEVVRAMAAADATGT